MSSQATSNSRVSQEHALIGKAANIPTSAPTPIISVQPISVPYPERLVDLQLKVSAPITGTDLPIILLSHGHGRSNNLSSLNGYGPLVTFWASHGFVVIQPTHLSSKTLLNYTEGHPDAPLFWKQRVLDMSFIIDHLSAIEASVPTLAGRLDTAKIAVAGHSVGGQTAGVLLGAQLIDPTTKAKVSLIQPRIKAGILLTAPGIGLSVKIRDNPLYGALRDPSFKELTTPTLVVIGDNDASPHLSDRDYMWHADPYTESEGPKSLLTVKGGEHILGGVSGWDARETSDESVEMVGVVQRMTTAYLKSQFAEGDGSWKEACEALKSLDSVGSVESK